MQTFIKERQVCPTFENVTGVVAYSNVPKVYAIAMLGDRSTENIASFLSEEFFTVRKSWFNSRNGKEGAFLLPLSIFSGYSILMDSDHKVLFWLSTQIWVGNIMYTLSGKGNVTVIVDNSDVVEEADKLISLGFVYYRFKKMAKELNMGGCAINKKTAIRLITENNILNNSYYMRNLFSYSVLRRVK